MQTPEREVDRRDFLKISTASTAAAFGTFALAGNNVAMAYSEKSDADSATGAKAPSMTEEEIAALPRVKQELVAPPFAPEHEQVASGGPKVVEITMTCDEVRWQVDDTGAELWAMTYNGTVPGPLVVCHQDDYVELTLKNPSASVTEHNIDFHASTGALGGGGLTHVLPGQETVLRFKATRSAAEGEPPAVAEWLTADLSARAGCGAGPAHLRAALAEAEVEDVDALLALDDELRFALPLYEYATNAALCAAFLTSDNVSRFMEQLGIEDSAEHHRLIPPPPPAPKAAPGPQRLRIIVQLAEDGRLEHAAEFASGETFVPRKRFLETDAEVDRWKISTLVDLDGEPVGWIRARRLADGRVEIGFRDANGVAIAPDVRFVPADLRPGEWMRSSEFVAPPQNRAGQPASGTDAEMSDGPPRFPVTGGGG